MEIFRTQVPVKLGEKRIFYHTPVVFIGSCFSEYIGNKVIESKLQVDNNPFGIVYNPLSVKLVLNKLIESYQYSQADLFNYEGIWSSFDHHSRFSDIDAAVCLQKINDRLTYSAQFLAKARFLFITFGTSYVYTRKSDGKVVSNCHKLPANEFFRSRLTVDDIVKEYSDLLQKLLQYNPDLHIVFTVSPVRHWKDGAHENQLSKAILLLAIDQLIKSQPQASYFPSYEIMMDDLRDYRFYDEDMLHPDKVAIKYIWGQFKDCYMEMDTQSLMKEVEKVVQAYHHRPFNAKTELYQSFVHQSLDKIRFLKDQYGIDFETEERYFKEALSSPDSGL